MTEVLVRGASSTAAVKSVTVTKPPEALRTIHQSSFYQRVFSPDIIETQIINLCKILDISWPDLKKINTSLSFPEDDITGFAVVVDYNFFSEDYSVALRSLLHRIFKKGIKIQNELQGKIAGKIAMDPLTKMCLGMCHTFGPFKIFPINTGHKWVGQTVFETKRQLSEAAAKDEGEWIEFPINSFDCLCLLASHRKRMVMRDSILPFCSGDIVNPNEDGKSCFTSMIDFDDEGRKFRSVYDKKIYGGREFGHYSVWTGFVRRDSKPA